MLAKRYVSRILFGIEIAVFSSFYLFGSNGIMTILQLKKDILVFQKTNQLLLTQVAALKNTLIVQQKNSFFQEKFAREQLHMARENEEIIYI